MFEDLLEYYEQELSYVRRQGAAFAKTHPKIAGRLRIGSESIDDPHVSRLIEAVAFLNARIHRKLDDEFPELIESLLGVLYPHYLAPLPSMAIVQFLPQADLTEAYVMPQHTALRTEPIDGEPNRFRTNYPVTLWPVVVDDARLSGRPIHAPHHPDLKQTQSVLRLRLRTIDPDMSLSALSMTSLRFFLAGQPQDAYPLHELILNECIGVALADSPNDPAPTILPSEDISPVGFDQSEGMLDYLSHALPGYRLLTDFFAFPEKFLFFDIGGLAERIARQHSANLEIFFYLKKHHASLEQRVAADMFALGCTPMINLFRQIAEPIQITHRQSEYRVVPDVRRTSSMKVHSIDRVTATSRDGEEKTLHSFYSVKHAGGLEDSATFWQAVRTSSVGGSGGTDFAIRLVDLDFDPRTPSGWTLNLETTCFNHDLPSRLPFGGGEPRLYLDDGGAALEATICLTAPTTMHVPKVKRGGYWRLVSHLNLNHLSLTDENGNGSDVLHEILRLYDSKGTPESEAMTSGFRLTGTRPVVRRLPVGEMSAVCRGTEVEIEFDPGRFAGSSAYLLALVLERFLGLYCNINSFTQLVARLTGKEGIWRQWPPRAGDKALL